MKILSLYDRCYDMYSAYSLHFNEKELKELKSTVDY